MKKIYVLSVLAVLSLVLSYCSASKKAKKVPKSTYAANLVSVIESNCAPCHIPAKGGNKKPYDNYNNVKTDIDEIIRRIQLNPTDRGFMPFKKTEKLSPEIVAVFTKWKADGMLEN
jgi:mono/diheme cytochrome c family protein